MNSVNKTLYIPLYGKSFVSKKGIILKDEYAENIWDSEGFELKRSSKNKYLAYFMAMRAKIFDKWLSGKISLYDTDISVLHLGCGMDSRNKRVDFTSGEWYDVDLDTVITERKKYFSENDNYHLIPTDIRAEGWIENLPKTKTALVVLEGITMYLTKDELKDVLLRICGHFDTVHVLADFYSEKAAKLSKYKNPVNDVGVNTVYGTDDPHFPESIPHLLFIKEHDMTPDEYINGVEGIERIIFRKLYAGKFAKGLYRIYEYEKQVSTH